MILVLLVIDLLFALPGLSPEIQCTVLKVQSTQSLFGFKKFPQEYMSISHDSVSSEFRINKKAFKNVKISQLHNEDEKQILEIKKGKESFRLEIYGKPISRKGYLFAGNKKLGDITCH